MDGVDPLPDQDPTEGPNGDESARPSVQPEAGAEYLRNAEADCVHERLGPNRPKSNPALSLATAPRSPAGYTRERLTTRFHTASTQCGHCASAIGRMSVVLEVDTARRPCPSSCQLSLRPIAHTLEACWRCRMGPRSDSNLRGNGRYLRTWQTGSRHPSVRRALSKLTFT